MAPLIREATEADLPRLIPLLAQLDPGNPRREDVSEEGRAAYIAALERIGATPGLRVFVLEDAGRLLATYALSIIPNLTHKGAPYAIIENVVTDAAQRGKRYGEMMMRHAIEEARAAGCYKLALTSNKRRTDAHRFYARLGFRAEHEGLRVDL